MAECSQIVKGRPLVRPAHLFDSNKFQVSNPVAANCRDTRTHLPAYLDYCLKGARKKREMGRWGGKGGEEERELARKSIGDGRIVLVFDSTATHQQLLNTGTHAKQHL